LLILKYTIFYYFCCPLRNDTLEALNESKPFLKIKLFFLRKMKVFLLSIILSLTGFLFSQTPTTCFEITSILVDGCDGGNEGKNEMVGLKIGPNPINVNDLRIDGAGSNGTISTSSWPNNPFLGFCTSPEATANLQILNDNIIQCGQLLEPPGGILPAGSSVIIITSTDYTPIPSYFANLTETIYVVFQCAGNTAGHFVNFGSGTINTRTLILNHLPSGCTDTVTYNRTMLLNSAGVPGAEDGGAVSFDYDNNPTYFNNGCQAPFIPTTASLTGENNINNGPSACIGGNINLTGVISGEFDSFIWSGGTGTFLNPTSLTTEYQLGAGDVGSVTLTLTVNAPCNVVLTEQFQFVIDQPFTSPLSISPNNNVELCDGQALTISASGGSGTYEWSTGETTNSISITDAGIYTVTSENACESETLSVSVTTNSSPSLTFNATTPTCEGECNASAIVNPSGGQGNYTFQWDSNANNSTSNSVTGLCEGTYNCVVTSGTCSSNINIVIVKPIPVTFTTTGTKSTCNNVCDGKIEITGITGGIAPYTTLVFDALGNQVSDLSNLCYNSYFIKVADVLGCESSTQNVVVESEVTVFYSISDDLTWCKDNDLKIGVNVTNGTPSIVWSTNETTDSISILPSNYKEYFVTLTQDGCVYKDTVKVSVIDCSVEDPTVIVLPNVFTPNSDGNNDFYVPITLYNAQVESFVILNRWGNIMAEFSDKNIKWDGLTNNKEASEGTYFYKFNYKDHKNESKELHGFFQLIRD
jgi:gliding motility-associated-like protein